jgi:hypothetical protein
MENFIIWKVIEHFIPAAYFPPIITLLSAFIALEQWLAATNRIKANSTLQLVVQLVTVILGKMKGASKVALLWLAITLISIVCAACHLFRSTFVWMLALAAAMTCVLAACLPIFMH